MRRPGQRPAGGWRENHTGVKHLQEQWNDPAAFTLKYSELFLFLLLTHFLTKLVEFLQVESPVFLHCFALNLRPSLVPSSPCILLEVGQHRLFLISPQAAPQGPATGQTTQIGWVSFPKKLRGQVAPPLEQALASACPHSSSPLSEARGPPSCHQSTTPRRPWCLLFPHWVRAKVHSKVFKTRVSRVPCPISPTYSSPYPGPASQRPAGLEGAAQIPHHYCLLQIILRAELF